MGSHGMQLWFIVNSSRDFPTVLAAPTITRFTAVSSTQLELVWMVSHVHVCL